VAAREAKALDLQLRANSRNGAAAGHQGQVHSILLHSIFAPGAESETEIYGRAALSGTDSGTGGFGSGGVGSPKSLKSQTWLQSMSVSESVQVCSQCVPNVFLHATVSLYCLCLSLFRHNFSKRPLSVDCIQ
jgi:hypothetical protein